jgi:hypothetical protein
VGAASAGRGLGGRAADPDRGWDAVVIGEYDRASCGSQYASMAPCSPTTASHCGRRRQAARSMAVRITIS